MIHLAVYAMVCIAFLALLAYSLAQIWTRPSSDFQRLEFHDEDTKDTSDDDENDKKVKVVIDQRKAFCQTVKFAMRLKRKMKRFKERQQQLQLIQKQQNARRQLQQQKEHVD